MSQEPIVYVVDDDPMIRESIEALLNSKSILTRAFADASAFLEAYDPETPGCLIVDVRMPGASGLDLQRELQRRGQVIPVIVISGHGDVPMATRAIKSGALDFIQKPFDTNKLIARVDEALKQDSEQRFRKQRTRTLIARMALLSDREREVLLGVVNGRYNKTIATELGVSVSTVEAHRRNIMRKLRAQTLYELIYIADTFWDRRSR
ncbi:response regulator [Aquisalimonas sp.]|uniref:response regulator transcription factor n=1 Tax=Aquisalimonas sp. TaxID=1872621 RepID=UPI0025C4BE1A|nr:response regulator [Aquisalimonas sp.]